MKQQKYIFYLCLLYFILNLITTILFQKTFLIGQGDENRYINSAIAILKEHKLVYESTYPTVFIMPGLPLLLSFVMLFFGTGELGLFAYRILDCLLQTGSLFLIYKIGNTLFSKKIAYLSVIFMMLYIPNYETTVTIYTEVPFIFCLLLLCYFSITALKSKKIKDYILVGVFWALASYFRPTLCFFPIIILILWIKNHYTAKEVTKIGITLFSVCVLCMSPWWIRNGMEFHKFIPFTESSGNPFFFGSKPFYQEPPKEFIKQNPDYDNFKDVAHSFKINLLPNSNERMMTLGISLYKYEFFNDPITFFEWVLIGKPITLYVYPFYDIKIFNLSFLIVLINHWIFLLLAIIGFFNKHSKGFIQIMILYLTLAYFPFFTYYRYAYPAMPFLLMLAAIGFSILINYSKKNINAFNRNK